MSSLLNLPDEIIEQILIRNNLQAQDIVCMSKSCHRFRQMIQRSATIWRRLFTVHFPEVAHQLEDSVHGDPHQFWQQEFVARYQMGTKVREFIQEMSGKHFHRHSLSNVHMEPILDFESNKEGILLMDAVHDLTVKGDLDRDLTQRFYGQQVSQFLRQHFLSQNWRQFMTRQDQSYYEGLVMISQWFQPLESISIDKVKADITHIAMATLVKLNEQQPNHPIFNLPTENKVLLNHDAILDQDRFGGGKNSLAILDALNEVFFQDMGFRGNTANYYNPANSYIDKVLESRQGIPITLCLLYSLAAKMLGIVTYPINYPRHFLLRWQYKPDQFYYIEPFQGGSRRTASEIKHEFEHDPTKYPQAKPSEVFQRMVRNLLTSAQIQEHDRMGPQLTSSSLLRTALELTKVIGGDFEYPGFALCQIYLQLSVNHREIIWELDNHANWPANMWVDVNNEHLRNQIRGLRRLCLSQIEDECAERREQENEVKSRSLFQQVYPDSEIRSSCFSVGMVMKHRRYNYYCLIFGWDPMCKATSHWINQMGVNKLPRKDKQPFYNVLVEDGSIRYAADENLEAVKPRRIPHPSVGRYFKHFHTDIGYELNDELAKQYPEDRSATEKFYLENDF